MNRRWSSHLLSRHSQFLSRRSYHLSRHLYLLSRHSHLLSRHSHLPRPMADYVMLSQSEQTQGFQDCNQDYDRDCESSPSISTLPTYLESVSCDDHHLGVASKRTPETMPSCNRRVSFYEICADHSVIRALMILSIILETVNIFLQTKNARFYWSPRGIVFEIFSGYVHSIFISTLTTLLTNYATIPEPEWKLPHSAPDQDFRSDIQKGCDNFWRFLCMVVGFFFGLCFVKVVER